MSVNKIAITGHTNGIGRALFQIYEQRNVAVVGLSRSTGFDITSLNDVKEITSCDVFVNNAYDGFGQVDLLYKVWDSWKDQPSKLIINISTALTMYPVDINTSSEDSLYRTQKIALEEAITQLRMRAKGPRLMLVKPGAIATHKEDPKHYANVNDWASSLVTCIDNIHPSLEIAEITLVTHSSNSLLYKD